MQKTLLVIVAFAAILSLNLRMVVADDEEEAGDTLPLPSPRPGGCFCIALFDPVCGVDGKTYGNSCEAACDGVATQCKGTCPCKDPCMNCQECLAVDYIDRPGQLVCNKCETGFKLTPEGYCEPHQACPCTFEYNPQCGVDGITYGNPCGINCAQVETACSGECPCENQKPGCPPEALVQCFMDPCQMSTCPTFPQARCESDYCGRCTARFFVGLMEVTQFCNKFVRG